MICKKGFRFMLIVVLLVFIIIFTVGYKYTNDPENSWAVCRYEDIYDHDAGFYYESFHTTEAGACDELSLELEEIVNDLFESYGLDSNAIQSQLEEFHLTYEVKSLDVIED